MNIGNVKLNNRFFLAPLAGVSNLPFRLINKQFGCALVYTEMISAQGLLRRGRKTLELLKSDDREKPVAYQIFGSDPQVMAEAAVICQELGADIVDINMGCPVKKVLKNGAGCALLDYPEKIRDILKSVRSAIKIPLTIKMRLGMESNNQTYLDVGKIAQDEGVDAVCLHPRTKNQAFKGDVDLNSLKKLKERLSIPVIGSGNLFNAGDALNMIEATNCDAVMIARGALGNPFIFKELIGHAGGDFINVPVQSLELKETILKHIEYFLEFCPQELCHREMKKHLIWYTKGQDGSANFRKLIVSTKDLSEMMATLYEYFSTK